MPDGPLIVQSDHTLLLEVDHLNVGASGWRKPLAICAAIAASERVPASVRAQSSCSPMSFL